MESQFISSKEIQMSYADTDMMGVICHGNYIKWFEIGRAQLIEDIGYNYLQAEKAGFYAPVHNIQITYKKSIQLGDRIFVKTWVEENDGVRVVYGYHIVNDQGDVCAEGTTTHVIVRKDNFKSIKFKKAFPEWFQKYEEIMKDGSGRSRKDIMRGASSLTKRSKWPARSGGLKLKN